jgi:hypothetical protein
MAGTHSSEPGNGMNIKSKVRHLCSTKPWARASSFYTRRHPACRIRCEVEKSAPATALILRSINNSDPA